MTVNTETTVVANTLADARSTQIPYCRPITNTFVAVGRAASMTAEYIQMDEKSPIQLSTR